MNPRESSRGREGMIGNGEGRRGVLDLDLNYPPPAEDSSRRYPLMGHANGFYQDQVTNRVDLEDDDDNVLTIFPRSFAEITRNARTGEEVKHGYHTDWLLITDLGFATLDELRALGASEGSNSTHNLPVRTVPPVSSLSASQQDTPSFTCGICLDQLSEETTTKCGHIFCRVCIEAAIIRQRKCPTCRQKLGRRDTIRIYLPKSN